MARLRILALHGYRGSAAILERQLAPLAAMLSDCAEFVCIDAPSIALGGFGWWHGERAVGAIGDPGVHGGPQRYRGWSETWYWLSGLLQVEAFDGVFGFSQGAALAALCVADPQARLGFAVMAGGFVSQDPRHANLLAGPVLVPSCHLIGRADTVVEPRISQSLADRFVDPLVVVHDRGHVIPGDASCRKSLRSFLTAQSTGHVGGMRPGR